MGKRLDCVAKGTEYGLVGSVGVIYYGAVIGAIEPIFVISISFGLLLVAHVSEKDRGD